MRSSPPSGPRGPRGSPRPGRPPRRRSPPPAPTRTGGARSRSSRPAARPSRRRSGSAPRGSGSPRRSPARSPGTRRPSARRSWTPSSRGSAPTVRSSVSFLRPVPMAKVRLVGLKEDRAAVFTAVHDSGVVQVEPLGKEALAVLEPDRGSETSRTVGDQMIRFRALKAALPPTRPGAPHAFDDLPAILAAARQVPIDDEVGALKREEDQLLTQRKGLTDQIDLLAKYTFYTEPLELLTGRHVVAFFGDCDPEKFEAFRRELPADAHLVTGPVGDRTGFLVAVPTAEAEAVGRLAQRQQV